MFFLSTPLWLKAAIVAIGMSICAGVTYFWPTVKADNPIEEVAEEIIEATIGVDVDLTPDSPENSTDKEEKEAPEAKKDPEPQ
jgi:hypothetical protein